MKMSAEMAVKEECVREVATVKEEYVAVEEKQQVRRYTGG